MTTAGGRYENGIAASETVAEFRYLRLDDHKRRCIADLIHRKWWMKRAALTLAMAALGACDVHSNKGGDADNVTINADESGHVAFNLPFAKGNIKLPEGMMRGGDFDIDEVKLMPGATMIGFSLDSANAANMVNMRFKAPQSPDQVRAYFLDQFKRKGIAAALQGDTVAGTSKDGNRFTIQVAPEGSGSSGTIGVADSDES